MGSLDLLEEKEPENEARGNEVIFYKWFRIKNLKLKGIIGAGEISELIKSLNLEIPLRLKLGQKDYGAGLHERYNDLPIKGARNTIFMRVGRA